jgi:Tol biopolymer transport system component
MKLKHIIYQIFILICLFIFTNCDDEIDTGNNYKEDPIDFLIIDYHPAWSPDGQWIAFNHADSVADKSGIYLISPDGEDVKKWHDRFGYPAWSPDGQWIAFNQDHQVWKKKINGDSLTQLTFEGRNYHPSWSPDGKWIAYDSYLESENKVYLIWRMQPDGSMKEWITYSEPGEGAWRFPDWHKNVMACIRYLKDVNYSEIFLIDSIGNNTQRITFNEAEDSYPKLSGNKVAYTFKLPDEIFFNICTINTDGTGFKQLTRGYTCDWSPDGKQIVYTDSRAENGRLWIMDADGDNKRQLTYNNFQIAY